MKSTRASGSFRPIAVISILGQSCEMGWNIQLTTGRIGLARQQSVAMRILLASFLFLPAVVQAGDVSERVVERIHSQLPLYTFDWDQMWPRSFSDDDGFGCTSRVPFGDWQFVADKTDEDGEEAWYRFENYGVFHCAVIVRSADNRAELGEARYDYGFFVRLGEANLGSVKWEVWALQVGTNPGSNYTLMARQSVNVGRIEDFVILQQRCPSGSILEAKGLDIWNTRYCAINSREELLSLARRMLKLPPLGTIKRSAPAE